MELVGRAREIETVEDSLKVIFQCCNDEVFELWVSPALPHLTVGALARVWTQRAYSREDAEKIVLPQDYREVITHWEDLS